MKKKILLLGATTGQATIGLLHLASYLQRNSIEVYCQWINQNKTHKSLKENLVSLLSKITPDIVGISIKWFPHMARGMEICNIIKQYSADIKVVVGGNTASYYWDHFINFEDIDYVIRGDGELPLLKLCKGDENIPNFVYKKNGQVIHTPFDYVHNENNSSDIYLSNLDEVFFPKNNVSPGEQFFIYTGKGCALNCFYCGGCQTANIHSFNRPVPFIRNIQEARKDLIEAKKYVSSFMFDFEILGKDLTLYHEKLWEGIDLSDSSCTFFCWTLPNTGFLELISRTFKNALIGIDICSLSERLRKELSSLKIVKPQPTDQELIAFFNNCEKYKNLKVEIDLILGMPRLKDEDLNKEEEMVRHLIENYSCFSHLTWGRLHAQPGAPIITNCEKYDMHSSAKTFEQFFEISKLNLDRETYPNVSELAYPPIYHNDRSWMGKTLQHFFRLNDIMEKHVGEN